MGIFTRMRDIVTSNINAILDKAEDPEKLVRLMIQEMEDTLVEVKSNCAGVMAEQKKLERERGSLEADLAGWERKARLAVDKGREDLARGAIVEKRRVEARATAVGEELERLSETVRQHHEDIALLEAKLNDARERQRSIIQRRSAATVRGKAQSQVRRMDTTDAFARFEAYERNIDRMESDNDLVNSLRPAEPDLHAQFADLEHEDDIEQELQKLKQSAQGASEKPAE